MAHAAGVGPHPSEELTKAAHRAAVTTIFEAKLRATNAASHGTCAATFSPAGPNNSARRDRAARTAHSAGKGKKCMSVIGEMQLRFAPGFGRGSRTGCDGGGEPPHDAGGERRAGGRVGRGLRRPDAQRDGCDNQVLRHV